MVDSNQIVIQKVENGFILTLQTKGSSLLGTNQKDKEHYVATTPKRLLKILEPRLTEMVANPKEDTLWEDDDDES